MGSRLKNRHCYSVNCNCQLGQASMLGDDKGALILIGQRSSPQRRTPDKRNLLANLAMSAFKNKERSKITPIFLSLD